MSDSSGIREEFGRQATEMANAPAFRSTDNLARIINALGPSPVGRVLDLACGPGIVAEAIAPWANELEGIDATPEMIALADLLVRMWPVDWGFLFSTVVVAMVETIHIATLGTLATLAVQQVVRGTAEFADTRYRVWQALHAPIGTLH